MVLPTPLVVPSTNDITALAARTRADDGIITM